MNETCGDNNGHDWLTYTIREVFNHTSGLWDKIYYRLNHYRLKAIGWSYDGKSVYRPSGDGRFNAKFVTQHTKIPAEAIRLKAKDLDLANGIKFLKY